MLPQLFLVLQDVLRPAQVFQKVCQERQAVQGRVNSQLDNIICQEVCSYYLCQAIIILSP